MPEPDCFEADFSVAGRDSDCFCQCQAAALLSYLQETGLAALAETGLSQKYLLERHNAFWMLVRTRYTLEAPILLGDVITVRTWSRDAHGMGLYRDYEMFRNHVKIGKALALWMPVDAKTRTLVPACGIAELAGALRNSAGKKEELRRLKLPDGLVPAQHRTVTYSQIDMNGHLNNSRYADLICDAIGMDQLDGAFVSSLQIGYLSECMPGCTLTISVRRQKDVWYIRGVDEDQVPHFEATALLKRP